MIGGTESRGGRLWWVALALVTLALLAANRSWIGANKRPPTFDDAWFLEASLHFYHRLTAGGVADFCSAYASSFRTKAPLISVLPLPFYMLLGARPQSALLVNFVFLVVANVYLFLLVRRWFSAGAGVAAVVFFQTMPLAYGLSRFVLADYGLTALIVAWMYYLVASERLTRRRECLALGIVTGLGLLMKIAFLLYVAGPALITLALRLRERPAGRSLLRDAAPVVLPALGLAATWYSFHLATILRYAWQAGYGEIGGLYGGPGFSHWFHQVINQGVSFYYTAAVVVFGLWALAASRLRVAWSEREWLLLSWFALPAAALLIARNREIRLVLPVLPVVAVALAAWLFRAAPLPGQRAILATLLAIFPVRLYAALTESGHYHDDPVRLGPFVVFSRDLGWARPPDTAGNWDQHRVLEALQRIGPSSLRPRHVFVGVEHPFFNANLFEYLRTYKQYPLHFKSLGYAETSIERTVEEIYRQDARFLLMAEGFHSHDLVEDFNRVNDELQARLDRGELPFRLRAKVSLGHQVKAAIYEREAPWTRLAAAAPSHPVVADFAGGLRFLGYDWKRRDRYLCEFSQYWTAPHNVFEDYRVNLEMHRGGAQVLSQDYFLTARQHPPYEWTPGEIIRQTVTVYWPRGRAEPPDARLWLTAWGLGDPHPIAAPPQIARDGVIRLRLEE